MPILMLLVKTPDHEALPVTKTHSKAAKLTLLKDNQWVLVRG